MSENPKVIYRQVLQGVWKGQTKEEILSSLLICLGLSGTDHAAALTRFLTTVVRDKDLEVVQFLLSADIVPTERTAANLYIHHHELFVRHGYLYRHLPTRMFKAITVEEQLEDRDVEAYVLADHLRAVVAVVGEAHLHEIGAVDDVRVGHDVTLLVDEEP